ncbi:DUF5317 domain-containing protein [Clostridium bowmanii]|uniref:DUF5317 domain-containing protein n=1 Tax=Clostridium bowmanii TaxID=132925 RepID=UPI001C0E75AC|nr:DUF5317 domain-containing protein [Clostridium bowmanii]MBU3188857.1 DUF5317 domain-containing protein [Clostridium bowmanii]MCA1073737.1 DUF5317 domain-containing protein [Clostridium bowmanii]
MFIEALFFAVIIGYILKGKIKNLENVDVKATYLVFISFFIEFFIVISIKKGFFNIGIFTYFLDFIMYGLLVIFIYFNRKNKFILLMGLGFLLNAIAIFLNGGTMPVGAKAAHTAGLTLNMSKEGLYSLINENTKVWFLGDIIPLTFLRNFAISIGDIIAVVGLMLFIITGMKKTAKN